MVWEGWRRGGVESDKLCDEMLMQERPPQKGGSQLCICLLRRFQGKQEASRHAGGVGGAGRSEQDQSEPVGGKGMRAQGMQA